MTAPWTIEQRTRLDADAADAVRDLATAAEEHDGVAALSEQTILNLATTPDAVTHLVVPAHDGTVAAYAQVIAGNPASAELVVHPTARRQRIATASAHAISATWPSARLWAHGDLPAARATAAALGMEPVRALHRMSLDLRTAALPPVTFPDGLGGMTVRAFRPGIDDRAWLETNAAAFARHPEQGRLGQRDLDARIAQDWFDPADFLLVVSATDPGAVAAYHWTKVTPTAGGTPAGRDGEVYVVGVHPRWQGRGLAVPVTLAGLHHLRERGCATAHLYVDDDNPRAVATYRRLGFTVEVTDRQYAWV